MKNTCRLDPIVYTARFYSDHVNIEKPINEEMDAYIGTATVTVQGAIAIISAASGSIKPVGIRSIFELLRNKGVNTVYWERHKYGENYLVKKKI